MTHPEPETPPSDPPSAAPMRRIGREDESERIGRLLSLAVVAGLVAGTLSWLAGESILGAYRDQLYPRLKPVPTIEDARRQAGAQADCARATYAVMGGSLGLALGLAGGLGRRRVVAGALAGSLGLALGAAAGAGVTSVLVPTYLRSRDPLSGDLTLPLTTHGGIWAAIGGVAGLCLGLGLGGPGRWARTLAGGLIGSAAATVVYEILGALAFPVSKTELPVSTSVATRALAHGLVALFAAVGAVSALRLSLKRPAGTAGPPSTAAVQ